MTNPHYAELHAHSAFSFLDGASQPEELVAQAVELGLSALALTDHDGLYGVVRFAQAARRVGLPTVFGAELRLPDSAGQRQNPTGVPDPAGTHLLVLARGPQGYHRLSAAIAQAHLATGQKGAADYTLEELASAADDNWLILTGCRKGAVRQALSAQPGQAGRAAARTELDRLTALFGKHNVAVEITDAADPYDSERNDILADLAAGAGVDLVATNNVHYATPQDGELAAALAAIRARRSLDDMDGWLPAGPTAHLRSAAEMLHRFQKYPDAVANAGRLGAECAFDLSLVAPELPPYPVPVGHTEASWLRELTRRLAINRYGPMKQETVPGAHAQIEHELRIIEDLNFAGYFLIVYDLVDFCHRNDILCQGRGSAANSAVCYALGITAVDAVKHGLLFERFLAPERDGPPDIDIDIESARREEVIQYVYSRFGRTHAAQVANVISYRPRSAVRDAARALGHDTGQQDIWSKSIERWGSLRSKTAPSPTAALAPALKIEPAIVERDRHKAALWGTQRDLPAADPHAETDLDAIPEPVLDLAERLLQLPRHLGIHSGGMVLCHRPVIDVCPVEWARMPGRTVLQWDKEDCADAGLVKFDLLGLGMLTALRIAFGLVAEHEGIELALHSLPDEDPAVYDLLCAADTVGVFQVESRAQMATLPRLQPRKFYDIVIEVALIRPGPIQGNSVHPYINRARGREKVTYLHELLRNSLERTLGVPLFQEQLMQMAIDVADFTPVEADQLRRAMGSKRSSERMEALRTRLMAGMTANGIDDAAQEEIFDKLKAFADFGFPESHAYSFAHLVYASAWLKVRHPAAFYAALLAAQPMGFYSPQSLVADARRHGIVVHRPDVQASGVQAGLEPLTNAEQVAAPQHPGPHAYEQPTQSKTRRSAAAEAAPGEVAHLVARSANAVRLGLAGVHHVSATTAERIVAAREAEGPFQDLHDLVRRVELSTAQLEALATAGALNCFGIARREALWAAAALAQEGPDTLAGVSVGVTAPLLPEMTRVEAAVADVWATGISPDSYPTQFVREGLTAAGVLTVIQSLQHEEARRVAVAGVVTHRQRPGTAKGVTFLSLEDETGILNVVCSPGLWSRFRKVARTSAALVIRGRLERSDGATNLVAEHLAPLSLKVATTSRDFQ